MFFGLPHCGKGAGAFTTRKWAWCLVCPAYPVFPVVKILLKDTAVCYFKGNCGKHVISFSWDCPKFVCDMAQFFIKFKLGSFCVILVTNSNDQQLRNWCDLLRPSNLNSASVIWFAVYNVICFSCGVSQRAILESPLNWENYTERFQVLLYLEELQMEVDIKRYNIPNTDRGHATMSKDKTKKKLLVLEVNISDIWFWSHLVDTISSIIKMYKTN